MSQEEDRDFELDVRRVARLLWPSASMGGAELIDGRERDGVFETEEAIHILECTVSRRKEKAVHDVDKIATLQRGRAKGSKPVQGWFITREDPTPEQRQVARQRSVQALSLDQFRQKLIDAHTYLSCREHYPFGSARDPESGAVVDKTVFVPLTMTQENRTAVVWSFNDLCTAVANGQRALVLGDYGAGKSTTLRELFEFLRKSFLKEKQPCFPILLNLRDHHGQRDPAEAIERHARNVGYPTPHHLVRAWRAGYAILILDGFDEIATPGWSGQLKKLRDIRYTSMELIRCFVRDTPIERAIIISGREHFFDSPTERDRALSVTTDAVTLRLNEFDGDQMKAFLERKGWDRPIPAWVPSRPLLLSYLATRGLLVATLEGMEDLGPAEGWQSLVDRICEREAAIEAGIDGGVVRHILECLATVARRDQEGLGPLTQEEIVQAFTSVCGYMPDDRGLVLLQRLPGLGVKSAADGTRSFVDSDLADVLRSGEVVRYIESPYSAGLPDPAGWLCTLRELGSESAAIAATQRRLQAGAVSAALQRAATEGWNALAFDLLMVTVVGGWEYSGSDVFVREVLANRIFCPNDTLGLSHIEVQDSVIAQLELEASGSANNLPRFVRCFFGEVEGRISEADLPDGVFTECTFERFAASVRTTDAILQTSLPLAVRVLLTVLRKLYMQRGAGRKETALQRGLDGRGQSRLREIMGLLRHHELAFDSRVGQVTIWHPVRSQTARVQRILAAPNRSGEPILEDARRIE